MKKTHKVYVKGDWNDADYQFSCTDATDSDIQLIQKMAQYFKLHGRKNPSSDLEYVDYEICPESFAKHNLSIFVTLDEYVRFDEYFMPSGCGDSQIHTIESIIIIPIEHHIKVI